MINFLPTDKCFEGGLVDTGVLNGRLRLPRAAGELKRV